MDGVNIKANCVHLLVSVKWTLGVTCGVTCGVMCDVTCGVTCGLCQVSSQN